MEAFRDCRLSKILLSLGLFSFDRAIQETVRWPSNRFKSENAFICHLIPFEFHFANFTSSTEIRVFCGLCGGHEKIQNPIVATDRPFENRGAEPSAVE